MYNKLQYISQGDTNKKQFNTILEALDSGCQWIQLRYKTENTLEILNLGEKVKVVCDSYSAKLIINDNVQLCQQLDADGVHLGLKDMSINQARCILGKDKIIGGTANTFKDIVNHVQNGCDYIGLGPFRFTKTKEKLSPILGLDGSQSILDQLKENRIQIPIYAIGGILLEDVESLIKTGIHGIAVSGLITESDNKSKLITALNENLYENIVI